MPAGRKITVVVALAAVVVGILYLWWRSQQTPTPEGDAEWLDADVARRGAEGEVRVLPSLVDPWTQLLFQGPLVFACLLGVILSLVFWSRCPGSSLLTLLASAFLLLSTFSVIGIHTYWWHHDPWLDTQGWVKYGQLTRIVELVNAGIRGLTVGLIVVAVFIGRRRGTAYPAAPGAAADTESSTRIARSIRSG